MFSNQETFTTKRKALRINLQPDIYGTLAEIGGGQEVARSFFQAGGASGTVAKSISAYDKTFSDVLYNKNQSGRYVSSDRLKLMLKKEFQELVDILQPQKDRSTKFFAFANTVETLNFKKTNQGHGWMGVRFQITPFSEPNEVIIHVRLLENDSILQQYTLGALGVNLIYACFNFVNYPNKFLLSLMDNLSNDRVDINMIEMHGPDLDYVDNRLLSVQLVKNNMTKATIFGPQGNIMQPSDVFYKKNLIVYRGKFRPITKVGEDIIKASINLFKKDKNYKEGNTLTVCEITLNNLIESGNFDERDFLDRVDILNSLGFNVMISSFREFYKLSSYLTKFRLNRIRMVVGAPMFKNIFNKKYYTNLKGGILEAFGALFQENVKLYVYPSKCNDKIITTENIEVEESVKYLYKHIKNIRKAIDITDFKEENLDINSAEVLEAIHKKEEGWENKVSKTVAEKIKTKHLFDY